MKQLSPVLGLCIFISSLPSVSAAQQGIRGQVFWVSGNQMPSPRRETAPTLGIERELHIHKLTTLRDVNQTKAPFFSEISSELVLKVKTRVDGSFKVKLPPGDYSLFVKESQGLFANSFTSSGEISKITVSHKRYTWVSITVDYDAVY